MAKVKGTWRFNDVLDLVDNNLTANINFTSTATYIPDGVKYVYSCEALRLREGYEVTYFEYLVQSSVPEDATFPWWRSVYWSNNWDAEHYDDGIKTITFTSEQEVSDEFYDWFTANATPQAKEKVFTKLYVGDIVATSGTRVFRRLTTEKPMPSLLLEPGLYDVYGNLVASWSTLVRDYGLNIGIDYLSDSSKANYYQTATSSPYYILHNYPEFAKATRLVIPNIAISAVTELPTVNVDTNIYYSLNGALYRYEETGSDDGLLGTWQFNGSKSTYGYGNTIGKNYFTFYDKSQERTYYGFYKSSQVVTDYWEFYTAEDYSSYITRFSVTYDQENGIHVKTALPSGTRVVVTDVKSMTDEGLTWWNTHADKIANEYSWVAYDTAQVAIPDSMTSIGDYAFYGCDSLTSIVIPSSMTKISDHAFSGNYSLIEICNKSPLNITAGGTDYGGIGRYAKHIITDEAQSAMKCVGDCVLFDDGTDAYWVKYFGYETEVTSPNYNGKLYGIYPYAFYNDTSITGVAIGNSVATIGANAFNGCSNLTTVTIGDSVTTIGANCFSNTGSPITYYINSNKLSDVVLNATSVGNIYFNAYSEDTEVLFDLTFAGNLKATLTFNIYTDNSILKEAALACVDTYTIVNVYHLDGSDWGE